MKERAPKHPSTMPVYHSQAIGCLDWRVPGIFTLEYCSLALYGRKYEHAASPALIRLGWEIDLLKSLINRRDAGDKEAFQYRGCAAHFPLLRCRTTETANPSQKKKPDGRETVWLLEGDLTSPRQEIHQTVHDADRKRDHDNNDLQNCKNNIVLFGPAHFINTMR